MGKRSVSLQRKIQVRKKDAVATKYKKQFGRKKIKC
jgi:hypothetical protein